MTEIRRIVVTLAMTCLLGFASTVEGHEGGGPFRRMFPQVLENIAHSINDTGF